MGAAVACADGFAVKLICVGFPTGLIAEPFRQVTSRRVV
jgi:hypothetical protein